VGAVVKQLAGIVHVSWCISGPSRAHADACLASERQELSKAPSSLASPKAVSRCTLHTGPSSCLQHSTSSHASPTPPNLRTSPAITPPFIFFLLISHYTKQLHHTRHANIPLPHAHYPPIHPSSSTIPACPCPTHRPVTRPPPDSPRPRYPYNPSRASAPSVNHLPFLPVARRHCASIHRRRTLLINHPICRTVHPTSQGPQQQQQQQPAIATSLYLTPNDRRTTTYARIEIAESVENPIADATTSSAVSRQKREQKRRIDNQHRNHGDTTSTTGCRKPSSTAAAES
jgi:hypothetical protein